MKLFEHTCSTMCQKRRDRLINTFWIGLGVVSTVFFVALGQLTPKPSPEAVAAAARQEHCESRSGAEAVTEQFVSKKMKAPGTAKFAPHSEVKAEYLGDCRHRIVSWVDAQNGFSAMTRNDFVAVVRSLGYDGKTHNYQLESLDLRER